MRQPLRLPSVRRFRTAQIDGKDTPTMLQDMIAFRAALVRRRHAPMPVSQHSPEEMAAFTRALMRDRKGPARLRVVETR